MVTGTVGFEGDLVFDASKPDGTPRKLLDVSKARELGWEAKIGLREGIERTYRWMVEHWDDVAQLLLQTMHTIKVCCARSGKQGLLTQNGSNNSRWE